MKLEQWEDNKGYLRQAYVKDDDSLAMAKKSGIRHEPPDLSEIDWGEVQRELHNELVKRGLITWRDVQVQQNTVGPVLMAVLKRRLISLYRQKI